MNRNKKKYVVAEIGNPQKGKTAELKKIIAKLRKKGIKVHVIAETGNRS